MSELSPAAQAIAKAALNASSFCIEGTCPYKGEEIAAAVLRAVAMEVVLNKYQYADWQMADMIMKEIQAIADELETQ